MSEEITLIVGKSYVQGMAWLRQNHKKYKLDPQLCRIITRASSFKGLRGYIVYWLVDWNKGPDAAEIRFEASLARQLGYIKQEIGP